MFSPPAGGVHGAYAIRPYTCYMPYIKIRPCFSNGGYVSVRDTDMFFEPDTRYPSKYGHVFRTRYTSSIEMRICFPKGIHVIHQNTAVFSEPDTRYPSKYERVFRTGYMFRLGIRICFPNRIHVTHRNTNVFSELGEGVDEPEDGEEDDGGAYDAVQYADAANVEPSAEA